MKLRRDSGEHRRARGKPHAFDRAASARALARATAFGSPEVRDEALRLAALGRIDRPVDLFELRALTGLVSAHHEVVR